MSAPLDLKKVRDALAGDPAFDAGMPEQAKAMYLELVDVLPAVLKDHLGRKVALPSLIEAKLALVEHLLETGFIGKMFAAVPEDALPVPAEEMTELVTGAHKQLRGVFMNMIHDTANFLASYGVSERQMLANPKGGAFNAASLAAYDAGTLTIRELLETQPAVIFING